MDKAQTTFSQIDALAARLHDAKIRCCWIKSQWDDRRSKEPWGTDRHAGTPNDPWHDIAIAQAKAALEFYEETP